MATFVYFPWGTICHFIYHGTLRELTLAGSAHTELLHVDRKAQERTTILKWISTLEHTNKHCAIRMPRVHGTGQWLLDHPKFRIWRDDIASNNVLWCHGIPGSGKSVLASLVIDQLQEDFTGHDYATVFAYFDYRDQDRQSSDSMTASLLQQISATKSELPESILNLHKKFESKDVKPQLQDLLKVFSLVSQDFDRVFVVIDALDECDEGKHRQAVIEILNKLGEQANIRLFITSRPHPQDIRMALNFASQITIEAQDSDLRKYLSHEFQNSHSAELFDESFKVEIMDKITNRANKM